MTDERPDQTEPVTPDETVPVEPVPVEPAPEKTVQEKTVPVEPVRARNGRRPVLIAATAVAGVIVLLLALMVFAPGVAPVKVGAVADAARAQEEAEVEKVATRFSTSLYSFNYRTIDADLKRIRSDSTGNFSKELESVLGKVDVFKDAIVEARGESTGNVEGVDVQEIDDGTATARVFVVQAIRNKKNPEPRQQFSAVELTLVETGGGWKVDAVKQFQTGGTGAPAGK